VVQLKREVRIRVCFKRLRKNASLDKERPPGLKPALISRGLRGPFDKLRAGSEGPLFHGGAHIRNFFRQAL
jgi:hypothetical protein